MDKEAGGTALKGLFPLKKPTEDAFSQMHLAAVKGISENAATALSTKVFYYQLQVKVAVKTNGTWVQNPQDYKKPTKHLKSSKCVHLRKN